jgi:hypothetical protein
MRRRWGKIVMLTTLSVLVSGVMGIRPAHADQPDEVKLRRWFLGGQVASGDRDKWDVFGLPDTPPGEVSSSGGGGGIHLGYRFGGRFLLGLQLTTLEFDIIDSSDKIRDITALFTGTVLFRERDTLQPFLRGGLGGGGVVLDEPGGYTVVLGTAVAAGGGLQVRVSSRFSFEVELAADFRNFQEVQDRPDGGPDTDWSVRTSHIGGRLGLGLMVWF